MTRPEMKLNVFSQLGAFTAANLMYKYLVWSYKRTEDAMSVNSLPYSSPGNTLMIAVLFSRMYGLRGLHAFRMQPAQMQPAQVQPAQMQPAQARPAQMQPAQVQPAQIQFVSMQDVSMQPAQMQFVSMQDVSMQTAQMQTFRPQQAGQLSGLNNVPSSRSTTTANVLSGSSGTKGPQPGIQTGSLIPLLPDSEEPLDAAALHKKVNIELEFGWKFDTRAWSKDPDPLLNYLYGFTRDEYFFIKQRKFLNTNPFDIQWEVDRQKESDRLNALRPWYRNEGTDDSDLVPLSDAALSKELDAFYGDLENVKISDVTSSDPINVDRGITAGVASNLSGTNGKHTVHSFVDEAESSKLSSEFSMKAGPGGSFIDSGIFIDGGHKLSLWKPARSSYRCGEESAIDRFPDDEDELTSDDHAPYDLEGLNSDRYLDTACDLQLGPWQAFMGEITNEYVPMMPDCPPDQPSSSPPLDSATSPLELNKSATGEIPSTPSVNVAVRTPSLMDRPTKAKWTTYPLNSTSSESSLPSSPETPTPQSSPLWEKRVINAGLAPDIERRYKLRGKYKPGDARYALLEQMSEMGARTNVSGRLDYRAFSTTQKNRKEVQKRDLDDEDAASDDTLKDRDAGTSWSSHKPLKKKSKKVGEMKMLVE